MVYPVSPTPYPSPPPRLASRRGACAAPVFRTSTGRSTRQQRRALEKVNAYLVANPKDVQGRFLKGLILTELNRNNEAIKVFSDITDDYPELPEPYNNLAALYALQGHYERAKDSLEMAIRTHPSYATAHENLATSTRDGLKSYNKALQLDKSNTSAQTKLAMIRDLFSPTHIQDTGKGSIPSRPARSRPTNSRRPPTRSPNRSVLPAVDDAGQDRGNDDPRGKQAGGPAQTGREACRKTAEKHPAKTTEKVPTNPKTAVEHTVHAWPRPGASAMSTPTWPSTARISRFPRPRPRAMGSGAQRSPRSRHLHQSGTGQDQDQAARPTIKVSFNQRYASNILKSKGKKTLIWKNRMTPGKSSRSAERHGQLAQTPGSAARHPARPGGRGGAAAAGQRRHGRYLPSPDALMPRPFRTSAAIA